MIFFFQNKRVCIIVRFGANFLRCVTSFGFGLRSRAEKIVHRFVVISDVRILREIKFGYFTASKNTTLFLFRGYKLSFW